MIRFWKLSGAGNDFVLLDARRVRSLDAAAIRRLCDRREGVGADGVLLVRRSAGVHAVRYFNADGSRAFCGNGTRCAAWWLHLSGAGRRLPLRTDEGAVEAIVEKAGRVRVRMPAPKDFRPDLRLKAAGRTWRANFVHAGVPHVVVEVTRIEKAPLKTAGPALRRHPAFGRPGANVDFVETKSRAVHIRTFERGVEDETLACGSGAVAAAATLERLGRISLPATLVARGGDRLVVSRQEGALWLEGPARVVFEGEVSL